MLEKYLQMFGKLRTDRAGTGTRRYPSISAAIPTTGIVSSANSEKRG
jgi:hypothetical protein